MVETQPIRVEIELEEDGRILATVTDPPGLMAYGVDEDEAARKVKSIALKVLADMIESGEDVPESLCRWGLAWFGTTRVGPRETFESNDGDQS